MKTILITDTLFIFEKHEEQLREAGFDLLRISKPDPTESELVEAIKDKEGYILGGIEEVSKKVIDAANRLEAICFTGTDYRNSIPAYGAATKKGIAITNCPGASASAVAEYAFTLMLAMVRDISELGRTGTKSFETTSSLLDISIGLVGLGRVGERVARMLRGFGVGNINYYSRSRKPGLEKELGIKYLPLDELLMNTDLVSLHASKEADNQYFGHGQLALMKEGSILVNTSFESAVEMNALYDELINGRLRAAFDGTVSDDRFDRLPLHTWLNSSPRTAYNTTEANNTASDMTTQSIINILTKGDDQYIVNPAFRSST